MRTGTTETGPGRGQQPSGVPRDPSPTPKPLGLMEKGAARCSRPAVGASGVAPHPLGDKLRGAQPRRDPFPFLPSLLPRSPSPSLPSARPRPRVPLLLRPRRPPAGSGERERRPARAPRHWGAPRRRRCRRGEGGGGRLLLLPPWRLLSDHRRPRSTGGCCCRCCCCFSFSSTSSTSSTAAPGPPPPPPPAGSERGGQAAGWGWGWGSGTHRRLVPRHPPQPAAPLRSHL